MSKYIKKIVDLNRYTTDSEANVKLSYKTLEAISSLWVKVADNPVTPTVPDVTRAIGVQTTSYDIADYTKIVDHFLNQLMKKTNQSKYRYDFVFTSNPEMDPEATLHKEEIEKKFTELKAAEPTPSFQTKYKRAGESYWIEYVDVIFYIETRRDFTEIFVTDDPSTPTINATVLYNLPTIPRHDNPAYFSYSNTAKTALLNLCTSRGIPPVAPGSPLTTYEDYKNSIIASLGTPTVIQKKIQSNKPEGVITKTNVEYFIVDLVDVVNSNTAPPPGMPRKNYEYILNLSGVLSWAGVSKTDPRVYSLALLPYDPNKFTRADVEKAENNLNRNMSIPATMGGYILGNVLALRASMIAAITAAVPSNFDLDGGQIAVQEMFSAFTPQQAKLFNARGLESYVANDGSVRFDVDKTMKYLEDMAKYEGITQFFDKRTQSELLKKINYPIESYNGRTGQKETTPYKEFVKKATYEQIVDPTVIRLVRTIARDIANLVGRLEMKLVHYQRRQRFDKVKKAGE